MINVIYELPFFKQPTKLAGKLLGQWQITAVTEFQTGVPITVGAAQDYAGIGTSDTQLWQVNGDPNNALLSRADRRFSQGSGDNNFWFAVKNPDGSPIFTQPVAGTFSNQTKNTLSMIGNPGFQSWNIALFKTFRITERQRVNLRAEAFNWLNHPNWGSADTNPTSATFGKVTSKSGSRNIQLSLHYSF